MNLSHLNRRDAEVFSQFVRKPRGNWGKPAETGRKAGEETGNPGDPANSLAGLQAGNIYFPGLSCFRPSHYRGKDTDNWTQ